MQNDASFMPSSVEYCSKTETSVDFGLQSYSFACDLVFETVKHLFTLDLG